MDFGFFIIAYAKRTGEKSPLIIAWLKVGLTPC